MLRLFATFLLLSTLHTAHAYEMLGQGDNERSRTWKKFAENVFKLHEKQLAGRKIRIESENGGYQQFPDSYREENYYDADNGLLLSRIKWRTDQPGKIHVIEVYIHDDKQRLVRDYIVAFVSFYYNHLDSGSGVPNQALVSFYNQHETLKAFRVFDASGDFVHESCEGTFKGKDVFLSLDDDQVMNGEYSGIYKACFDGLPTSPGEYLDPH